MYLYISIHTHKYPFIPINIHKYPYEPHIQLIYNNKVYLRFYVYFKCLYMGMYWYILVFMGTYGTVVSDNQEKRFN